MYVKVDLEQGMRLERGLDALLNGGVIKGWCCLAWDMTTYEATYDVTWIGNSACLQVRDLLAMLGYDPTKLFVMCPSRAKQMLKQWF